MAGTCPVSAVQLIAFVVIVIAIGAAVLGIARLLDRRRRTRKIAAQKAQQHEAAAVAEERRRWVDHPEDAIQLSYFEFSATRLAPLRAMIRKAREAETLARQHQREEQERSRQLDPNLSPGRRVVMPILAALWLVVFGLQVTLDIQIMHGLYPKNPVLAWVIGTTAAVVITGFALWWTVLLGGHSRTPVHGAQIEGQALSKRRQRWRLLNIAVGGAVVLIIMIGIIVGIAPARSRSSNLGRDVVVAEKTYTNALELAKQGAVTQLSVAAAKADLDGATAKLEQAENVDRSLAVMVPTAEIVLSFPAVLSGELLLAMRTRRRARKHERSAERYRQEAGAAQDQIGQALDEWQRAVAARLLQFGTPLERLRDFMNTQLGGQVAPAVDRQGPPRGAPRPRTPGELESGRDDGNPPLAFDDPPPGGADPPDRHQDANSPHWNETI
jgi:hypothetical protein